MKLTYDDFMRWKGDPVTKIVFHSMYELIRDGEEELGETAGIDPLLDRFKCGRINGLRALLEISVEDVPISEENE